MGGGGGGGGGGIFEGGGGGGFSKGRSLPSHLYESLSPIYILLALVLQSYEWNHARDIPMTMQITIWKPYT